MTSSVAPTVRENERGAIQNRPISPQSDSTPAMRLRHVRGIQAKTFSWPKPLAAQLHETNGKVLPTSFLRKFHLPRLRHRQIKFLPEIPFPPSQFDKTRCCLHGKSKKVIILAMFADPGAPVVTPKSRSNMPLHSSFCRIGQLISSFPLIAAKCSILLSLHLIGRRNSKAHSETHTCARNRK